MVKRKGKFGFFYGCSRYPECKNIRKTKKSFTSEKTGIACPIQGCGGELVSRLNKRGKVFYGCNNYPKCTFLLPTKPVATPCPVCGFPVMYSSAKGPKCPHAKNHES